MRQVKSLTSKNYDLNVYVVDSVLHLSAYEHLYADSPEPRPIATNTSKWHTLPIPLTPAYDEELSYTLGKEWNKTSPEDWQDYDSWEDFQHLTLGATPSMLKEWAEGLPAYTPEAQHEWEEYDLFSLGYGEEREIKCLNCTETYTQRRAKFLK